MAAASQYRRDIDGLRALAILPVVLFHLGFRYTPGGYVGVDVFFVISGYLITQHIYAEIEKGTFSIVSFYEKRARRILPAVFAMFIVTSVIAYLVLFPSDLADFGRSLTAAVGFSSNFYFWSTLDYFHSGQKPLLHTWSLAVEEQFYLFYPVFLLLLRRFSTRRLPVAIVVAAILSLCLSAVTVQTHPAATFYLPPQRAWELLTGGILAIGAVRYPLKRVWREVTAGTGLVMILLAVFCLSSTMPFPGPLALLPCLGAAMVIAAGCGGPTLTGNILSLPPLVGIGLISYSLYLWHLPLIVFSSYFTPLVFGTVFARVFPFLSYPQAVTMERLSCLLGTSILLAALSWKFIEQPIRFGRLRPSRRTLFQAAGFASLVCISTGVAFSALRGIPSRFSPETLAIYAHSREVVHYREGTCLVAKPSDFNREICLRIDRSKTNWLLMGDSHAAHLYPGLVTTFPEIHFLQMTILGCKPVPVSRFGESASCFDAMRSMYDTWLPRNHIAGVILAANWQSYDLPRIEMAVRSLQSLHYEVVLIGPIMHYDMPLPLLLAFSHGLNADAAAERHRIDSYDNLDVTMAQLAADTWHIGYFSFTRAFCHGGCRIWSSTSAPIQWDESHLTDEGSRLAAEQMRSDGLFQLREAPDTATSASPSI